MFIFKVSILVLVCILSLLSHIFITLPHYYNILNPWCGRNRLRLVLLKFYFTHHPEWCYNSALETTLQAPIPHHPDALSVYQIPPRKFSYNFKKGKLFFRYFNIKMKFSLSTSISSLSSFLIYP